MLKTREVRNEIVKYINDSGVGFTNWHVGTASHPHTSLFTEINIDKDSFWIYKDAGSKELAQSVVKFMIDTYGTIGDTGNEDETCHFVYAYAITQENKD